MPTAELRQRIPDELEIEECDGSAWLSIVFFRVRALRARGALPVPGISSFLQLNVRTYVRGPDGLPGVWFFSIDASSRLAALGVRRIYHVPAFHARMTLEPGDEWQEVECVRLGEPGRVFAARYRANGETFHAELGSLEWFLTERYRLFSADARAEMHHDRWLLSQVEADVELSSIVPFTLGRGAAQLPLLVPPGRADLAARADRVLTARRGPIWASFLYFDFS